MTKTVLVVGLGLIGGSVALALQKAPDIQVIGYDVDEVTMKIAKQINMIEFGVKTVQEGAEQADVIVFATPVSITVEHLKALPSWNLKERVIVTDTGSTKQAVMAAGQELRAHGITLVGGHPMAGSHKSGVTAAKPHLFENAYYILTALDEQDRWAVDELKRLLRYTHSKIVEVSAEEHDHMTAVVSHFPHIISASLVHQLQQEDADYPMAKLLAAGGFRDVTRIASSNPSLWRDITLQNRDKILEQLTKWQQEMERVKDILQAGIPQHVEQYFGDAKKLRDSLPFSGGALFSTFDLQVDIPDYPGVISVVTGLLADENISITNLRIVEAREDVYGILVISFQTEEDRLRAQTCIETRAKFETHIA